MADFNTTSNEEFIIDRVRRDGFGYSESLGFSERDFPKYIVLRVALARALQLPKIPLNSPQWEDKTLSGEKNYKEYHLDQLTGKGKDDEYGFDTLTRALLYIQHKDELDRDNIDIFSDDKRYTEILGKYIRRGLYELRNSWKSNDCFYQWCLDNLNFNSVQNVVQEPKTINISSNTSHFVHLYKYFRQFAINIRLINETDSYYHHICKIELESSDKISAFKTKAKYLDDEFGFPVLIESCEGMKRTYNIQIAKPESQWQNLRLIEFKAGLEMLKKQDFRLGIYAGNEADKKKFCFDLADTPHCFVAGATKSGKTKFIQTMIVCLLQNPNNVEVTVIDPKEGVDFKVLTPKIRLITNLNEIRNYFESMINEMQSRFIQMSEMQNDNVLSLGLRYKIIVIDELKDLIDQEDKKEKELSIPLGRLAQKARQAGIHLILGTQRPDSDSFSGILRSNIPSRIALKVQKSTESKIILDEIGAEKLLGRGDMLIKLANMSKPKHIFSCLLQNDEIKSLI